MCFVMLLKFLMFLLQQQIFVLKVWSHQFESSECVMTDRIKTLLLLLLKCGSAAGCCSRAVGCSARLCCKCVEVNAGQLTAFSWTGPQINVLELSEEESVPVWLSKVFCVFCVAAFRETTLQWRWDHGPGTSLQKSQRTPCQRSSVYPAGTRSSDQETQLYHHYSEVYC